ncbi:MAG: hypothetical protein FJ276_34420, partial [Planctomycetes bacterium]|nr:hypothetical protein [Planctomycetota bacterium]
MYGSYLWRLKSIHFASAVMAHRTCPTHEQIAAYLEDALDVLSAERLAAHVETCPDCQAMLATMCEFDDTLLAQLRVPAAESPYVHESACDRAVRRAAAEGSGPAGVEERADQGLHQLPAVLAQLREYDIVGDVKAGGMGCVYRAVHTRLGRTVAIKLLLKHRMSDPKAVARFEREMKLVGGLCHPNIVQAYDAREIDGVPLLVMEFLEGMNLSDVLHSLNALPVADACELARQAAMGLSYAHQQKL